MVDEEQWRQVQHGRKSRRQRAWLSQPVDGSAVGNKPAQSGVRRQLPLWLRRSYEPPIPPWRSGGKGGGKTKSEGISGNGATMAPFVDFAHITIRVLLHAEQTLHDDTWATSSGVDASATPIRICVQNKGVELETDSNV